MIIKILFLLAGDPALLVFSLKGLVRAMLAGPHKGILACDHQFWFDIL